MNLLHANLVTLSGGTQAVFVQLPVGCRLKSASGHNGDRPFSRVKLYLTSQSLAIAAGPTTPAIGDNGCLPLTTGIQGGMNDQVTWHGDMPITNENCVVVMNCWNCLTGNNLNMEVGIEV